MGETTDFLIASIIISCIHNSAENTIDSLSLTAQKPLYDNIIAEFITQNVVNDSEQNSLPQKLAEDMSAQFISGKNNEDIYLNVVQLIRKYGFSVETHEVQTEDGYILTMFRIPSSGPAVFLMHGLLSSADDWVTAGRESGIAYLLADRGYDVWLGNARGNKHSRRHAHLAPDKAEFWDFSWDEIGRYDLPAMIDHALAASSQPRLRYVGHSQGTTAFFVLCSERPKYNDKVTLMVALSAVAWMSNLVSPVVRLLSPVNPFLYSITKIFGFNEFLPDNDTMKSLKVALCRKRPLAELFCNNILFLLCGFDYAQVNYTNLPVIHAHLPSGAAAKQLIHYAQSVVSGKFQRFDYGVRKNKQIYGTKYPPEYPVDKITAPVAIFYSDGDWLASVKDVQTLQNKLKNVADYYEVPFKNFNHLDFLWAKDVKQLIFSRIMKLFTAIK